MQADIFISGLSAPRYVYGQPVQIGDDDDDPTTRPFYVVANIPRVKWEPNPDQPDKNRTVCEVYLARQEEWENFGEPEEFERIRNGTQIL